MLDITGLDGLWYILWTDLDWTMFNGAYSVGLFLASCGHARLYRSDYLMDLMD